MRKGLLKKWHPVAWMTLACVLVLGHGSSGRAEVAAAPSLQDILEQITMLQRAVIALQNTVDGGVATKLRRYYLTPDRFTGAEPITACAKGFHMASLWEIFNMSTLEYDRTLGMHKADAGAGPPTGSGWIRTGNDPDITTNAAGIANCDAWTSANANHYGTIVGLDSFWRETPFMVAPWGPSPINCHYRLSVWCVED